jgi:hypothetical protein
MNDNSIIRDNPSYEMAVTCIVTIKKKHIDKNHNISPGTKDPKKRSKRQTGIIHQWYRLHFIRMIHNEATICSNSWNIYLSILFIS